MRRSSPSQARSAAAPGTSRPRSGRPIRSAGIRVAAGSPQAAPRRRRPVRHRLVHPQHRSGQRPVRPPGSRVIPRPHLDRRPADPVPSLDAAGDGTGSAGRRSRCGRGMTRLPGGPTARWPARRCGWTRRWRTWWRSACRCPTAVTAATRVPADLIGCPWLGGCAPGAAADLTWLGDDLRTRATWIAGRQVYAGPSPVPGCTGYPSRCTLCWAAWARGRITMRSTLKCAGLVTAQVTASATSSAVSGSATPA